jgi:hypothetical protein
MTYFTTDRIIILCLLAIIGLANIANRNIDGFTNKTITYSEYLLQIEPIKKQIIYFKGKNKITTEKETELLERLTKTDIVNMRLKKTDIDIQADIDIILNDLINIVGNETYVDEASKIQTELYGRDTNKMLLLDNIEFFSKIGDISPAESSILYAKIWATQKDDTYGFAEIQSRIDNIRIPDYALKTRILKEIEYFRNNIDPNTNKPDLLEPKVAEIYAKIYADHSTIGLNRILNDYLEKIPDYKTKIAGTITPTKPMQTPYVSDVADITYHESAEDLRARDKTVISVKDASGNMITLPWDKAVTNTSKYNDSTYFRFSPSPYVPDYEDSVYLSRLTRYNEKNTQLTDYATGLPPPPGGFCSANKDNKIEIETQCGKIGTDACASTSCCVLLGGSRCVAGDATGPTNKSNYNDISILNPGYYYYRGKCYGNCM